MKPHKTYIGLGSNMGNRAKNLQTARELIEKNAGRITKQSSIYETAAWGNIEQDSFFNQAIEVETALNPTDLIASILNIEKEMGRIRELKWGSRLIDIDILYYSNFVVEAENLTIPHPFLHERRFVLIPLSEISANFIHPKLKKTNKQLLKKCKDGGEVWKLSE